MSFSSSLNSAMTCAMALEKCRGRYCAPISSSFAHPLSTRGRHPSSVAKRFPPAPYRSSAKGQLCQWEVISFSFSYTRDSHNPRKVSTTAQHASESWQKCRKEKQNTNGNGSNTSAGKRRLQQGAGAQKPRLTRHTAWDGI